MIKFIADEQGMNITVPVVWARTDMAKAEWKATRRAMAVTAAQALDMMFDEAEEEARKKGWEVK